MPVQTLQFDHSPQGFTPLQSFLDDIASRPGMDARLRDARKRIAQRAEVKVEKKLSLALLRMKAGLSQKQLAVEVGTSQPVVSMWEAGTREPSLKNLSALAKTLQVSADDLLLAMNKDA